MKKITLLFDGVKEDYPVKFTISVLAALERETEHKNILNELMDFGLNDSIVLAYLGLKKADPNFNMTLEEVGDAFILEVTMVQVFEAFASDMSQVMSTGKK